MKRLIKGLGIGAAVGATVAGGRKVAGMLRLRKLSGQTKDELYSQAQEADIPGRSQMTKDELVDALKDA